MGCLRVKLTTPADNHKLVFPQELGLSSLQERLKLGVLIKRIRDRTPESAKGGEHHKVPVGKSGERDVL